MGTVRRPDATVSNGVDVGLAELTHEARAALAEFKDSVMLLSDYDIEVIDAPTVGR